MTQPDAGDWRVPDLQVTPFDGTTVATLEIEAPDGAKTPQTPTSADNTPQPGTQTWTGQGYELATPGEWIERWTVTGAGASKSRAVIRVAPDPAAAPSGQRLYATTTDYANWLLKAPPAGARRALLRASRAVDRMLLTAIYPVDDNGLPTETKHIEAIRDATCAQAEYARGIGDPDGVGGQQYSEVQLGSARLVRTNQPPAGLPDRHSDQAREILQQAGLTGHEPWTC